MDKINDGGPAFPGKRIHRAPGVDIFHGDYESFEGMTLRDYFAAISPGIADDANADQLELCFPELGKIPKFSQDPIGNSNWWCFADAAIRYRYADAMLAQRTRKDPSNY